MTFLKALAIFLGTVIGVGIFGLPYAAMKAGFFVLTGYIVLMTILAIIIHLLYSEVAIATKENLRLPGYVKKHLNSFWKNISIIVFLIALFTALLPYLLIGGEFLNSFLSDYIGDHLLICTLSIFLLGAYLIFKDIGNISVTEFLLVIFIIAVLAIFAIIAFPVIKINNLFGFDKTQLFFPYGIVLFSLWGTSIIPDIEEFLQREKKSKKVVDGTIKKVIVIGLITAALVYIIFSFVVIGTTGINTSTEAISGMEPIVGRIFAQLGYIFGLLCCFTTFIAIGLNIKKTLWYDFKFSKDISWLITCALPIILFMIGIRDFLAIIGFIGAVSVGLESILIVFLYRAIIKKFKNKTINPILYLIVIFFILGIISEGIHLF